MGASALMRVVLDTNVVLSTAKLQQAFGLTLPSWGQGVDRMLQELG